MRFRQFDHLRSFCLIARHSSFTSAAQQLHLTKGAVIHQIDRLEAELGVTVFTRRKSGIKLTENGIRLLRIAEVAFDSIEQEITRQRNYIQSSINIGMATYFASRWLSPRLMNFITEHPDVRLRIQPVIGNPDLANNELDMSIRWGKGDWLDKGLKIERIFASPAMLAAGLTYARKIESSGFENLMNDLKFLDDADDSQAWADWFAAAGLEMPGNVGELIIPDPNVRVQAVIDGQGVALYDTLVKDEVERGSLFLFDQVQLNDYGYYLVYPQDTDSRSPITVFRDWIMAEAALFQTEPK